jgi:hypothetical protein
VHRPIPPVVVCGDELTIGTMNENAMRARCKFDEKPTGLVRVS